MFPFYNSKFCTLEQLFARHGRSTSPVYLVTLLAVSVALLVVPRWEIEMTVRGEGSIRPVSERQELRTRVSGIVEEICIKEADQVQEGQLILRMRSPALEEARRYAQEKADRAKNDREALEQLVRALEATDLTSVSPTGLPPLWMKEWDKFQADLSELILKRDYTERENTRTEKLRFENLVPASEAELRFHEFSRAASAVDGILKQQQLRWRAILEERIQSIDAMNSELQRLNAEMELLSISVPARGVVEQLAALSKGTHVLAGDRLASLSPDADLQAEVFVDTREVASLRIGQPARLQIEAFPYAEWGCLAADVSSISQDAIVMGGKARFRVLLRTRSSELRLKSGIRGQIQRGMAVQARFLGQKRPLWRIALDRTAAWWDPD